MEHRYGPGPDLLASETVGPLAFLVSPRAIRWRPWLASATLAPVSATPPTTAGTDTGDDTPAVPTSVTAPPVAIVIPVTAPTPPTITSPAPITTSARRPRKSLSVPFGSRPLTGSFPTTDPLEAVSSRRCSFSYAVQRFTRIRRMRIEREAEFALGAIFHDRPGGFQRAAGIRRASTSAFARMRSPKKSLDPATSPATDHRYS